MSIRLEHVSYIYDADTEMAHAALEDVDLEIADGSFIGLIGHTGSGKSTLIQHLNGLLTPTAGRVLVDGEDIAGKKYDRRALRAHVGLVFQYPEHQLFEETCLADVCFGPKNLRLSQTEAEERARRALQQVGLDEQYYKASPFELSGGQKRRVAIAGVLAMDPRVLILDEPTAGLDPSGRAEILTLIAGLHREMGITVILVSHSMEDVADYCGRLIVMNHGRVAWDGTPAEVFRHYQALEEIGLAAPEVTYIMRELAAAGIPVDSEATKLDEAVNSILKLWRKGC
ncbi:MAG: energy-coupling factor transporter ATPase [Butyrivibrio sp.]|nr:energy-coupling factor transporter ATPase [Butyrivibrio sp.]